MQRDELKIYQTLGEMHTRISTVTTFDEAVQAVAKAIVDEGMADHVIVWCSDGKECYPYYWIFPLDVTTERIPAGQGIVGKVCETEEPDYYADFIKEADGNEQERFQGANVTSVSCVPFHIHDRLEGCIEFLRTDETKPFTEEEKDVCALLSDISELYIREMAPDAEAKNPGKVLLSARDVQKSFRSGGGLSHILKGVNVDVFNGELLCLQGESGCGKSTFLNIAGGLLNADGGRLLFMDRDVLSMTEKELTEYRRDFVGFVFQSYNLMPNLTAKQNLDLIAELVENPMDSMEALELVGMKEKANRYPAELSGGQQQRVSIARALVKRPKLIFADEPTAALDYKTSIEVLSVFERIKENGTTVLMVTHNGEITRMADRVIRFRDGKTYEIQVNQHPVKAAELKW